MVGVQVTAVWLLPAEGLCGLVFQCEVQSDPAVLRVRVGPEEPAPGPAAGLRPVEPHDLSGSGGLRRGH